VYRMNASTPFPVIVGIYLLCFVFIFLWLFFSIDRTEIVDSFFWQFLWASSFVHFINYFIAIQCSGMLIAFSLFVRSNMGLQKRTLSKFMSTLILTLIVITCFYIFAHEILYPIVQSHAHDLRSQSAMSNELYRQAAQKKISGDYKTALAYIDFSLAIDKNNPEKINEKMSIMSNLSPEELHIYEQLRTNETQTTVFDAEDVQSLLEKAEKAYFEDKDYMRAYSYAESVLTLDSSNKRAMWISNIAWEEISARKVDPAIEKIRYLISEKRRGYEAYSREDYIRAYYIFKTLDKQYPHDPYIEFYLNNIIQKLPDISFFIDEAELILSLSALTKNYFVFINDKDESSREIMSIDGMVKVENGMFFKNIEVIGFLKQGTILYHYIVPYGKLKNEYININGIEKEDSAAQVVPQYLRGVPPIDKLKGIKLNVDPLDFSYYKISADDLQSMSIWQLVKAMGILTDYAHYQRVLFLELLLKISMPILLLVFSMLCARIAIAQSADYISNPPRILYLFLPIIPFIVLFIVDMIIYLYKIITGFFYFSFGVVFTVLILLAVHTFIIAVLFFNISRRLYKQAAG
jgi:hypothetical protein